MIEPNDGEDKEFELIYPNPASSFTYISPKSAEDKIFGQGTEFGFFKTRISKGYYFQCAKNYKIEGETLFCQYYKRYDHHNESHGQHKHIKPTNNEKRMKQTTIDSKIRINTKVDPILNEKIAIFTSLGNLAIDKGCSLYLYSIFDYIIDKIKKNPDLLKENNSSIVQKMGCKGLHDAILATADKYEKTVLSTFMAHKYSVTALDGGCQGRRHFIDFCLTNPLNEAPYAIHIEEVANLNCSEYKKLCLDYLTKKEITNSAGFVGDGLPTQVASLSFLKKTSIQNQRGAKREIRRMIYSPCWCHRIQLCYLDLIKTSQYFKLVSNEIQNAIIFIRKPEAVQIICSVCPELISTRWLFMYESLIFIKEKKDLILEYFATIKKEFDFNKVDMMINVLYPLKSLILSFSRNDLIVGYAYPMIKNACKKYNKLMSSTDDPQWKQVLKKAHDILINRTINSEDGYWLSLSYSLTPSGRSEICSQIDGSNKLSEEMNEVKFPKIKIANLLKNKKKERNLLEKAQDLNELITNNNDVPLDENPTTSFEVDQDDENSNDVVFTSRDNGEIMEIDPQEVEEIEQHIMLDDSEVLGKKEHHKSRGLYQDAYDGLSRYLIFYSDDLSLRMKIKRAFSNWCTTPHNQIPHNENLISFNIWKCLCKNQEYQELSDIAFRSFAFPCSQTCAERTISIQRYIYHERRRRSHSNILDARLKILAYVSNRQAVSKKEKKNARTNKNV